MQGGVCVLGASGLLGHYVVAQAVAANLDVVAAGRDIARVAATAPGVKTMRLDLTRADDVHRLADRRFDAVLNCAGLTKQLCMDAGLATAINAEGPHRLSGALGDRGTRLVHVSTDCVFRGDRGLPYPEDAAPDADDVYGQSKAAGEIGDAPHLTVRTSFVGRELHTAYGLLEWFLRQRGTVRGFTLHLWNGLGAPALARVLLELGLQRRDVTGILNVAGEATSKLELLRLFAEVYDRDDVTIVPDNASAVDRRLDPTRLTELGIRVPPLREMVTELRSSDRSAP